jgi:hypothetical protein
MGFTISWVAYKDLPLAEAALAFGLLQSGQSETVLDYEANGARVGNWSIVVFNDLKPDLAEPRELARLSSGREIVVVHISETTMMQWAERWKNGRQVWNVQHTSEEGPRHLETTGSLPAEFAEIRRRRFAEQDEEDAGDAAVDFIADIPLDLAEAATGFRHDSTEAEFFELVPDADTKPKKAGFLGVFKMLFGGGQT